MLLALWAPLLAQCAILSPSAPSPHSVLLSPTSPSPSPLHTLGPPLDPTSPTPLQSHCLRPLSLPPFPHLRALDPSDHPRTPSWPCAPTCHHLCPLGTPPSHLPSPSPLCTLGPPSDHPPFLVRPTRTPLLTMCANPPPCAPSRRPPNPPLPLPSHFEPSDPSPPSP